MEIIKTDSLFKSFGKTAAVNNVSMSVSEGEIYAFLGLNGAGKSTTIRMLLGMLTPHRGSVSLFGKKVNADQSMWNDVGYLIEGPSAYPNLSVKENLEIVVKYRRLQNKNPIGKIMEELHLEEFREKKAGELSTGNRQRLGLAKAMIHEPKLLILDEPINGLDPAGIVEVRGLLKRLSASGSTIFLSSHILSEISRLATRIGIIHEGKLIHELSSKELEARLSKKLVVNTRENRNAVDILIKNGILAQVNKDNLIEISDKEVYAKPENISVLLVEAKLPPTELYAYEENLEEFFLRIIGTKSQL